MSDETREMNSPSPAEEKRTSRGMQYLRSWVQRTLEDPQVVVLILFLVLVGVILTYFGRMLAPVLLALMLAYLVDSLVVFFQKRGMPRLPVVLLLYTLFLALFIVVLFILVPLLSRQLSQIPAELPKMFEKVEVGLRELVQRYDLFQSPPEGDGSEQATARPDGAPPGTPTSGNPTSGDIDPGRTDPGSTNPGSTGPGSTEPGSVAPGSTTPEGAPEGTAAGSDPISSETGSSTEGARRGTGVTEDQFEQWLSRVKQNLETEINALTLGLGKQIIETFRGAIVLLVYTILVPILVFFMLKDKEKILGWCARFVPQESHLVRRIWSEVDQQIGNYIRGKVWEILIVGGASFLVFQIFQLQYAPLLALLVGVSVVIPYVGATIVTFPVVLVAYAQWGVGSEFLKVVIAYMVIQVLDGNLLVPLLFGEVNKLHPVAIIVAVLIFGGLWGVWGVFFAIPLATLVQAIIQAWPRRSEDGAHPEGEDGNEGGAEPEPTGGAEAAARS